MKVLGSGIPSHMSGSVQEIIDGTKEEVFQSEGGYFWCNTRAKPGQTILHRPLLWCHEEVIVWSSFSALWRLQAQIHYAFWHIPQFRIHIYTFEMVICEIINLQCQLS